MRGPGVALLLPCLTAACVVKGSEPPPRQAPAAPPPVAAVPADAGPAGFAGPPPATEPPPVDGGAAVQAPPAAWPPPDGVTRVELTGRMSMKTVCHKRACRRGDPDCPCRLRIGIAVDAGPYTGRGFDVDGHGCRAHGASPGCPYVDGKQTTLRDALLACQAGYCRVVVAPHAGATIAGTVAEVRPTHCGGARLPVGKPLVQRRPWAGQILAVALGREYGGGAPATYAATDAAGKFAVDVPPGTWCLIEAARTVPAAPSAAVPPHVDQACMAAQRRRCDAVVDVPQTVTPLTIELARTCFGPCYRGPLPP